MDEWLTYRDTLMAKVQELYFRAQAHPGDPAIAQEIQDFTMAIWFACKPLYDRLYAITEQQCDTIHKQVEQLDTLRKHNDRLIARLQQYQAFRMATSEALALVTRDTTGA